MIPPGIEPERTMPRWAVWLGAALLLLASLTLASKCEARWSPGASLRVAQYATSFETAARYWAIPGGEVLLAAICGHETYCLPVQGRHNVDVWGPMQVSWRHWGEMLRHHGIASKPEDLLDVETGIQAGAAVLYSLAQDYPSRNLDLILCLYSGGTPALAYTTDCPYSRAIMRELPKAARALWLLR